MTTALIAALLLAQAPASSPTPAPAPTATPVPAAKAPAAKDQPAASRKDAAPKEDPAEQQVLVGFDAPTGKKFTGEFRDRPVSDALRQVAKAAGLSIVLPPGLFGTVNADFNAAPVEDIFRIILEQNDLRAERKGSIVTVTRAGSGSLVIKGGKRKIRFGAGEEGFRIDIDADEIRRQAQQAAREAERVAREIEREARDAERAGDVPPVPPVPGVGPVPPPGPGGPGPDFDPDPDYDADDDAPDRVLSGDQVVKPGERVGELVVLRGNVRLEPGSRARQVTAVMGSVDVGPGVQIEREVVAVGGDVHVAAGAYIGADVVSVGGKLVLEDGARIDGQQTAVDVPGLGGLLSIAGSRPWSAPEAPFAIRLGHALAQFAMFLALGLLLLVTVPRRVESVGRSLANQPAKALLTGFLGTLALPVLALLLVVTVIGIPLVAVLVLAVVAGTILGFTALAQMLGERLPIGTRGGQVLRLAIGTALLIAATKIPILGILVWVAGWLFIFGAVLRTRFGQPPPPAETMPLPPPFPPAPPPATSPPPVAP